jgi:hypothetical protein
MSHASILEKIDRIVDQKTRSLVKEEPPTQFQAILHTMVQSFHNWYVGGQKGMFSIPSFDMRNSNNETPPNDPIMATPPNDAPCREHLPTDNVPSSTSSSISIMPSGNGGVSHWLSSNPKL